MNVAKQIVIEASRTAERPLSGPLALLLLVAWFGAAVLPARAQQPEAAAEALFRAGRDASHQGDARTACDRYRESYRLEPALGTLLNIASCELTLGELSEAWRHFQDVAHALPAGDPRVAIANEKLAQLERRLPHLTITRASTAPAEVEVWIGQVQLSGASFGVALPIDPGSYRLEARCPGREVRHYALDVAEGEQRVLEVEAGAVLAPVAEAAVVQPGAAAASVSLALGPRAARAASDRDQAEATWRSLGYALIGAGAASFAAGAVCAALALDRLAVVHDHCDAEKQCDARGLAASESGRAFFFGSLITLGVSLAAAGPGTYLLLSAHDGSRAARRLDASATASAHFFGGTLRMRFE